MLDRIAHSFDRAAPGYDSAAQLQQRVAQKLVSRAQAQAPLSILDIGCGTGAVASLAARRWPLAQIAGVDTSATMLKAARKKIPCFVTVQADAAIIETDQKFDLIFSSMLLHWLPKPEEILRNWTKLLNPGGAIHVALPVAGSLSEWRDLCRAYDLEDGLWDFPDAAFAQECPAICEVQRETIIYENLHGFLGSLKRTGAHQSRPGHAPASIAKLRRLLNSHSGLFTAGYDILYLSVSVP